MQTEADGPLDSPRAREAIRPSVDERCCAAVSSALCRYVDAVIAADCWAAGAETKVIDAERAIATGLCQSDSCAGSSVAIAARAAAANAVAMSDQAPLAMWKDAVVLRSKFRGGNDGHGGSGGSGGRRRRPTAAVAFSAPQLSFIAGATRYLCRRILGNAFRISMQNTVPGKLPTASLSDLLHGLLADQDLLAGCEQAREVFGCLSVQCPGGNDTENSLPFCAAGFGQYRDTCPLKSVPAVVWHDDAAAADGNETDLGKCGDKCGDTTKRGKGSSGHDGLSGWVLGAVAVVYLGGSSEPMRRLVDWAVEVQTAGACACLFIGEDDEIFSPSCPTAMLEQIGIPVAIVRRCDARYFRGGREVLVSLSLSEHGLHQFPDSGGPVIRSPWPSQAGSAASRSPKRCRTTLAAKAAVVPPLKQQLAWRRALQGSPNSSTKRAKGQPCRDTAASQIAAAQGR